MTIGRRDLLKFLGGSVAGIALTPIPWKLTDGVAIWSQNWSWIPRPPRGEIRTRYTNCTLCPAGCGVRARCVGEQPVSLWAVANHPLSRGVLCPFGLGGHHVAVHPRRMTKPYPAPAAEAISKVREAITQAKNAKQYVAVLDEQPGRMMSLAYRRFLAELGNGIYLAPPAGEDATLAALQKMLHVREPLGLDLENARTILCFGTPLLDGWGTPGRVMQAFREKRLNIIEADPRQSRTASLAATWLPIRPGTEGVLALGIANVLIQEKLFDAAAARHASDFAEYARLLAAYDPGAVADTTGISAESIRHTARELAGSGPSLVLGGADPGGGPLRPEEETAIAGLNLLLGSFGKTIVARSELPLADEAPMPVSSLASVADRSIRVLILDGASSGSAIPWALLEKKLTPGRAVVLSLSPYAAGHALHANYVIPAPAYLESLEEVTTPFDAKAAYFALSTPLLTPPAGVTEPLEVIQKLGGKTPGSTTELLKQRVDGIQKTRRGTVFTYADAKTKPLADVNDLWKALIEGGCWIDSEAKQPSITGASFGVRQLAPISSGAPWRRPLLTDLFPLVLLPAGVRGDAGGAPGTPLLTKVYQESNLRRCRDVAALNPATAAAYGLADGAAALLETQCGKCSVRLHVDDAVMPGVVEMSVASNAGVLDVCNPDADCTWRTVRARISKA